MSGFYGVALYHPVTEANVGTVWRSAMTYKASFIGTVGRRYKRQASDTCKTPLSLPLHHYGDLDDLIAHLPWGCRLIGVELDPRAALGNGVVPQQCAAALRMLLNVKEAAA